MTKPKAEKWSDVHAECMKEFDNIQSAQQQVRLECLSDRRFYSITSAQWEGGLGQQFEYKPRFEFNKVHLAVIRIINEYRNNRITVTFSPKDGEEDDTADVCAGLYRADEKDSVAEEAYDNAFEEGVGGGFGAWRLRACYEDEDDDENEKQRIKIEPIFDADTSVYFDLNAKRQDKADAKSCYVVTAMDKDAYKAEYNDDPASWPKTTTLTYFDWCTPDVVYVAEVYKVEEKQELIHVFRGLDEEDMMVPDKELQEDPSKLDVLTATGFREVRQKKVRRRQVHKWIMSGSGILKDEGVIAGKCIPVVPFYGKRWYVDNIERCMGHVRLAKDAQRIKNMQMSQLGEISAMSPVEKPIVTPEQIAGHTNMWAEDNIKNYPYRLLNAVTDKDGNKAPPSGVPYTKAPSIPPALAALLQITEQDIQDLLGNQQAGEEMQSNISGKVVELVQTRLDMQTFIYMSNFAKAMKRSGEIWLSMMKDIAVEEGRRMKTVGAQNEVGSVLINEPAYDRETGSEYVKNDLSAASFDVYVDVGPSSSSRRQSTIRMLTSMLAIVGNTDPETSGVLTSMAMMNMEGEGVEDAREYFRRKLLKMGVIKPTEEEAQELAQAAANAPPDPNAQLLLAEAQKATAETAHAEAKSVEALASAELKGAQKAKTLVDAGVAEQSARIDTANAVHQLTQPINTQN